MLPVGEEQTPQSPARKSSLPGHLRPGVPALPTLLRVTYFFTHTKIAPRVYFKLFPLVLLRYDGHVALCTFKACDMMTGCVHWEVTTTLSPPAVTPHDCNTLQCQGFDTKDAMVS